MTTKNLNFNTLRLPFFQHFPYLAQFFVVYYKTNTMVPVFTSSVTKKLVLQYAQQNIDFRKRSLYLQEIITIGKTNKLWLDALVVFFDTPLTSNAKRCFSKN